MRIAALIVLGSLVPGTRASAQAIPVQQHQGLWGGFGVGTGVNLTQLLSDPADGLPSGGGLWGFTGYGRIGGTLSQRVLLGGESAFWIGSRDGVDFSRGNLSAVVLFYPQARGGLFLKAGISPRPSAACTSRPTCRRARVASGPRRASGTICGWGGTSTSCPKSGTISRPSGRRPAPPSAPRPVPTASSPSPWASCGTDSRKESSQIPAGRGAGVSCEVTQARPGASAATLFSVGG